MRCDHRPSQRLLIEAPSVRAPSNVARHRGLGRLSQAMREGEGLQCIPEAQDLLNALFYDLVGQYGSAGDTGTIPNSCNILEVDPRRQRER